MVGPVLFQELLLGSRRNRLYVLRWCYGGWLLLQLSWLYFAEFMTARFLWRRSMTYGDIAAFAQRVVRLRDGVIVSDERQALATEMVR